MVVNGEHGFSESRPQLTYDEHFVCVIDLINDKNVSSRTCEKKQANISDPTSGPLFLVHDYIPLSLPS